MSATGLLASPRLLNRALLPVVLFAIVVNAACECGFRMNDTRHYFTHIIYSNFSQYSPAKRLTSNPEFKRNWAIQQWSMPSISWATPLPVQNLQENVYLEDGTMILRQIGYPKEGVLAGRNVSIASVAGQSGDLFHGSFRTEFKLEGADGGSVAAFFWYHDDQNEIDMEVLTREIKPREILIHYTTHPAVDESGNLVKNATAVIPIKGNKPGSWYQRHRFDWSQKELKFYFNDTMVHANDIRMPNVPGRALLNLWADGGIWSGAPSITDVFMKVKYVVIYHNTTASDHGMDMEFNARCTRAGGPSSETICLDTFIEGGAVDPSSTGAILMPLSFWVLSLLWLVLGIVFTTL
ncbi:predicted protein [Uncinocarpus reesii 1704]|uniref:GH16 domain-containing protein n=1 Tax=Uncinocarpus reesii (strain UAMH 1704) TaxID=336963 RepID=C4JKH6_UNCRE|nr:uncharacterized protein UREG_02133 [Uncinocarpus reesii 1704]EEP77284.1 predicted protein [Uncinocarpus reesii 1704]